MKAKIIPPDVPATPPLYPFYLVTTNEWSAMYHDIDSAENDLADYLNEDEFDEAGGHVYLVTAFNDLNELFVSFGAKITDRQSD
jgi:hypothetical protein